MARRIPEIIPAVPEHIAAIADHARDEDRREFAALGWSIRQALVAGLRISRKAWTGMIDGNPVCMFGVAPGSIVTGGKVWMLGTEALDDPLNAIIFLRRCRKQVDEMLEISPVLTNYVHAENARAISWLRWLGFKVEDNPVPYGPKRELFYRFSMTRSAR